MRNSSIEEIEAELNRLMSRELELRNELSDIRGDIQVLKMFIQSRLTTEVGSLSPTSEYTFSTPLSRHK